MQLSPYTFPLILTGVVTLFSAAYTFYKRHVSGADNLLTMLLAVTLWIFTYSFELSASSLPDKLFWAKVEYIGIVYIPVGYTLFVLNYIGGFRQSDNPKKIASLLLIIPMITLLLTWTNEWHGFIWKSTVLHQADGHAYLTLEHGFWFWLYIAYVYLLLSSSAYFLLRKIFTTPANFRGQFALVFVGSLFPWAANVLYLTGSNPFPNLDLTPFAFALTAVCFAWALFQFNFLDIVPIARGIVIDKLEDGVIVLDTQNRVVDINQTAVTLLRLDKKQVLGRPLPLNQPQWLPLAQMLQSEKAAKAELMLQSAYYKVSSSLLGEMNQKANGRLITLHNITTQKETERLLQQAKEAAEATDRAKTNFLTNMSHEIRTPINAVVGMTELLRQTNLNPNQKELIDVVAQSSSKLVSLINNILDFAKLEAGDLQLREQSFDLVELIEAAMELVKKAANDKLIQLSYHVEQNTPTRLVGDALRLKQILVNLLDNGIKFTNEGKVNLFIKHRQEGGQILLQILVQDSGIGIAQNEIPLLFATFRQVDGSTTRAYGGNGLGLAICKQLVALMGGEIEISSTVGQGTAVHFTVKLNQATDQQIPVSPLKQQTTTLTNKRLLVINSNASQRRQISREARIAGLEVYAAGSAQEVSYWIQKSQPFDIAMLDVTIWQENPGILKQICHKETKDPLPTILLVPEGEEQQQLDTRLFSGLLTLPIVATQLYDGLMDAIATSTAGSGRQPADQTMADRYPLKILMVEDNKLNQRVLQNMLNKLGYRAETAVNGALAVEAAAKTFYDIILMDIQMPVMDGVEATKRILAGSQPGRRPFIVAVTAHALAGDRENYLAQGMDAYISKPFTINQLVETLYQAVGQTENQPEINPEMASYQPLPAQNNPGDEDVPDEHSPIDMVELARLVGKNTGQFLEMMAPIFVEDCLKILGKLETAVQTNDKEGIRQAAHTLKGTSASMAMTKLSQFSYDLETLAKSNDLRQAAFMLIQIQDEYHRAETTLNRLVSTAV